MQTLEKLRRKIDVAEELQTIVRTMKTLAMVNIRHYEQAVVSLADYNRTIEMGLQVVLRSEAGEVLTRPLPTDGSLGAIIFGSDQGLCGRFNEQIAAYALATMDTLAPQPIHRLVMSVGGRGRARLEEARQPVDIFFPCPTSLSGITPLVQEILLQIEAWQSQQEISRIMLFYNRPRAGLSYHPQTVHLLPLNREWLQHLAAKPWPSRVLPTYSMNREQLFSALIRQYLFVSLYRAFAESAASENASRLTSLQAAERNIEESLDDFQAQYHHQRQDSITAEILDIVAGFEALVGERK
jgi:F-type H+-transporting ATPase subunit gamma